MTEKAFAQIDALSFMLAVIASKRARKSTPDYYAALDDIKLVVEASIECLSMTGELYLPAMTTAKADEHIKKVFDSNPELFRKLAELEKTTNPTHE